MMNTTNWNNTNKESNKPLKALKPEEIDKTGGGEKEEPEVAPIEPQPEIPDEPNKLYEEQLPPETQLV